MVATFSLLGTPEPDSMLHSFLMRTAAGGVLVIKAKGTVGVHGDDHGDDQAHVILGALVEFLGKGSDVDAVLTQGRANGGRGVALPAGICSLTYPTTFCAICRHLLQ